MGVEIGGKLCSKMYKDGEENGQAVAPKHAIIPPGTGSKIDQVHDKDTSPKRTDAAEKVHSEDISNEEINLTFSTICSQGY